MVSKCRACGLCCKLFYINLAKTEYKSGKYRTELEEFGKMKNFKEAEKCGANLLAKKVDGECIYLENNLCGIHNERPVVCREFFCTTKEMKFQGMVEIIKREEKKNKI